MCDDWSDFEFTTFDNIPKVQCIYFLMNDIELVYIGQTNNLRNRMYQHNANWNCTSYLGNEPMHDDMFDSAYYLICEYKPERREYEDMFRSDYWPKLNGNDWVSGRERILEEYRLKRIKEIEDEKENLVVR